MWIAAQTLIKATSLICSFIDCKHEKPLHRMFLFHRGARRTVRSFYERAHQNSSKASKKSITLIGLFCKLRIQTFYPHYFFKINQVLSVFLKIIILARVDIVLKIWVIWHLDVKVNNLSKIVQDFKKITVINCNKITILFIIQIQNNELFSICRRCDSKEAIQSHQMGNMPDTSEMTPMSISDPACLKLTISPFTKELCKISWKDLKF